MLLTTLIDTILIETGNHIFDDDVTRLSLSVAKIWTLARRQLLIYQKFEPRVTAQNVTVVNGIHTFTTDIPEWISACVPIQTARLSALGLASLVTEQGPYDDSSRLDPPRNFIWEYVSPRLSTSEDGTMDVVTVHNYTYTVTMDSANVEVLDVDISGITESDDKFIDLVTAVFLISIGRSKRAFTINDLPLTTDASELISEGGVLKEATMDSLKARDKWYLAVRP